jgi:uncharacterized ubiquitin-like protein YukD
MELLLGVCNDLAVDNVDNLNLKHFKSILQKYSVAKNPDRRAKDILRVLISTKFVNQNQEVYSLTEDFYSFIQCWDNYDLIGLNRLLSNYEPYKRFLNLLERVQEIEIPPRQDKVKKNELNEYLKKEAQLTFTAFDTFKYWSLTIGQAYKSPYKTKLFWGGEWDKNLPDLRWLYELVDEEYKKTTRFSTYANVGLIGDTVCQSAKISFQAFELKLKEMTDFAWMDFRFASITKRTPPKESLIITLRKRDDVLRDKKYSNNYRKITCLENRNLDDGVEIKGSLFRLIRRKNTI